MFKNLRTGKVETINKDDIDTIKWMKRSRGYGLKFITKSDTSFRYDGFKDTVRISIERRSARMIACFFLLGYRTIERVLDN